MAFLHITDLPLRNKSKSVTFICPNVILQYVRSTSPLVRTTGLKTGHPYSPRRYAMHPRGNDANPLCAFRPSTTAPSPCSHNRQTVREPASQPPLME